VEKDLARLVRALSRAEAYPHDASAGAGIERVQTHLSHVFLTPERVYKLHKHARFEFVDFSSRAERDADAAREVALNRRLAADVYLGLAPVRRREDRFEVGSIGEALAADAVEHCVVMRRLPEGRDALTLLSAGRLERGMLGACARRIARFHAEVRLGRPAPFSALEWRRRAVEPFLTCFAELERGEEAAAARRAGELARARAARLEPALERRRLEGRAVDGHGDLHLQHLWFLPGGAEPLAIDCIAFSEELRRIDAACDVAFLAMDLRYRAERGLSEHFLQEYAAQADDHDLYAVVDFFVAYRAAVRAKVAGLAAADLTIPAAQRERARRSMHDHLALAHGALEPAPRGRVIALTGLVGTGKSSVARALAAELDGVVVSSDRVRKAQAGIPVERRAAAGFREGLYRDEPTARVYAELTARARTISVSGRIAILDASFALRSQRDRLRSELGAPVAHPLLLEVACAPEVSLQRLEERARGGTDPSDAGPELYAALARAYEPPDEWPPSARLWLRTDEEWTARLRELARSIALRPDP
jgi:hypothetical protein